MQRRPLNRPFSRFFYERLRAERIKPRRLRNPKGIEKFTFSVSTPRQKWARDIYYDPQALRNLDYAINLLPELLPMMTMAFEHTMEHEKVHVGESPFQVWPVGKIKRIANLTNRGHRAQLFAEQAANDGLINRILKENRIKSMRSPQATKVIAKNLSGYIIQSLIQNGDFRRLAQKGSQVFAPKSKEESQARVQLLSGYLEQLFPVLTKEAIRETIRVTGNKFTALVDKASRILAGEQ